MQLPSSRVALGSVLILVAAACGTATDVETTSTLEIAQAPTASTTSTIVTTTSTVTDTTTTTALSSDYPPEEDYASPSPSTTSTTQATSTTETTSTTLSGTTTTQSTTTTTPTATTTAPATTTTVPAAKTVNVSIVSFSFGPSSVTINVGDTIRWTVNSGTHTTTATGVWNSGATSPGGVFSFNFDQAGTYPYFCSIHPNMQATVTVEG
jgi:plastocyanin